MVVLGADMLLAGLFDGRDDWIRTSDLTHPKGALYQAEPRPDYDFQCTTAQSWQPQIPRLRSG